MSDDLAPDERVLAWARSIEATVAAGEAIQVSPEMLDLIHPLAKNSIDESR